MIGDEIEFEPPGDAKRRLHSGLALETMSSPVSNIATIIQAQRKVQNIDLGDTSMQGAPLGQGLQTEAGALDAIGTNK